jgi:hypothetical protein
MKRLAVLFFLVLLATSAIAKTHNDMFNVPCSVLWPAVKDTLRNSGKYGVIGIDNNEMTASYNIGGFMGGKRINSLILNDKGQSCELQVQTSYSGLTHDDAGDMKDRIEKSLQKLQAQKAAEPPKPAAAATPAASETKPAEATKPADTPKAGNAAE